MLIASSSILDDKLFSENYKYMILLNIFVHKTFLPILDHFFGRHRFSEMSLLVKKKKIYIYIYVVKGILDYIPMLLVF